MDTEKTTIKTGKNRLNTLDLGIESRIEFFLLTLFAPYLSQAVALMCLIDEQCHKKISVIFKNIVAT